MASSGGVESARYKVMLQSLRQQDPEIDHVVAYSKFVVVYLLHQDGPNPGWRKANIEGPVYLVRRRAGAGGGRYQLLVKNQFSTNDLLDDLHPDWELDCQKNYIFYKIEDTAQRIRGLWFHDDNERTRIEASLQNVLEEIRRAPLGGPQGVPGGPCPAGGLGAPGGQPQGPGGVPNYAGPQGPPLGGRQPPMLGDGSADALYAQFGLVRPQGGGDQFGGPQGAASQGGWGPAPADQGAAQGTVMVTEASLRTAFRSLADDDFFIQAIAQKLKEKAL